MFERLIELIEMARTHIELAILRYEPARKIVRLMDSGNRSRDVFDFIKKNPGVSVQDIADNIGLGRLSVLGAASILIDEHLVQEFVGRIGAGRNYLRFVHFVTPDPF